MKLDQDDVARICQRIVDHDLDTQFVAVQFEITRRRVQQLATEYRETDEIPELETLGRTPYADSPADLHVRILELYERYEQGPTVIVKILRLRDGLTVDTNAVYAIVQEYEHETENPNKQGRKRPWVCWERDFSLVTVHIWTATGTAASSGCWASRTTPHGRSSAWSRPMLAPTSEASSSLMRCAEYFDRGEILEVITDHGAEFYAPNRDEDGEADHPFEAYLDEHGITQTLCAVGRPQSNGTIERFFLPDDKQRGRFDSVDELLEFYNDNRPHMSLDWDRLEMPNQAFERVFPTADDVAAVAVTDDGDHATK